MRYLLQRADTSNQGSHRDQTDLHRKHKEDNIGARALELYYDFPGSRQGRRKRRTLMTIRLETTAMSLLHV